MAANSSGAGLRTNLTAAQLDQDFGSDAATVINALRRFKSRYDTYWAPYGAADYQALKNAAGDSTAAADAATMGSAVTELLGVYNVVFGSATIAVDGGNGGNGVVTTGAAGSGHNFFTLINRVCGDTVS